MQLPRGSFREIKKNEAARRILEGLENERFSGICTLSSSAGNGILVYRKGKYVLAKVREAYGDAGIAELQAFLDQKTDAALSSLDETQINLALEFNQQAVVKRTGSAIKEGPANTPHHHAPPGDTKPPAVKGVHAGTQTVIVRPAASKVHVHLPGNASHPAPRSGGEGNNQPQKHRQKEKTADEDREESIAGSGQASFDLDMDEIDTLDLDKVQDKIRGDCKTMIKQLDLEYLLER